MDWVGFAIAGLAGELAIACGLLGILLELTRIRKLLQAKEKGREASPPAEPGEAAGRPRE